MKKEITILQENISPLVIIDDDDSSKNDYAKEVSKALQNSNITLLHTSSCSVILRPHKISSIVIRDLPSKIKQEKETHPQPSESEDGIITD